MVGYAKAVWRGSPNHYQGRNGYKVTHITLHIMVGSLQGTDTVFQRSSYRASSTYGVGTDGTVYQWVDEINGAWCDANMASDCSGISIEHAGGIAGIAPTDAEYEASAQLPPLRVDEAVARRDRQPHRQYRAAPRGARHGSRRLPR